MHDTEFNNWIPFGPLDDRAIDIKAEPCEPPKSLLSPPDTPCRRRSSPLTGSKRVRPYPLHKRISSPYANVSCIISDNMSCNSWSLNLSRGGSNRSTPHPPRRSSAPDDTSYSLGPQFISVNYGADETTWCATSHVQQQQLPLAVQNAQYSNVTDLGTMSYGNMAEQDLPPNTISYTDYHSGPTRNASPDSISSGSSAFCPSVFSDQFTLQPHQNDPSYDVSAVPVQYHGPDSSSDARLEADNSRLRRKLRELEAECTKLRSALEATRSSNPGGLPTPMPTPPQSASFQASWKARTEARRRIFCSLNRAGNALCAWHDSRRERRTFPPRNAPPGYLNCGCTYEEALFEESLARHHVGSYYPGETVRMDPALRNPLLKLLQQRYGYRDGDFERDSITGDWLDGEGPAYWEQQAHSGATARRRIEHDRH